MSYKIIKSVLLNFSVSVAMLAMLGSCSSEFSFYNDYNNPYAHYLINGTVVDEHTEEPVSGILVKRYETYINYQTNEVEMLESVYDTCEVDKDGKFIFSGVSINNNYEYMYLECEDIDSSENGNYEPKLVLVKMETSDEQTYPEEGYQGLYSSDITIGLSLQ